MNIKTEAAYRLALKEIESLMTAKSESPEGKRLVQLTRKIKTYEQKHYQIDTQLRTSDL